MGHGVVNAAPLSSAINALTDFGILENTQLRNSQGARLFVAPRVVEIISG